MVCFSKRRRHTEHSSDLFVRCNFWTRPGDSQNRRFIETIIYASILLLLLMMVPTWQRSIQDDSSRVWVNRIYGFGENPHAAAAAAVQWYSKLSKSFSRPLLMLQNSIRLEHRSRELAMPDTLISSDFLLVFFGFKRNSTFGHISDRFTEITFQLRNFLLFGRKKGAYKLFYDYCRSSGDFLIKIFGFANWKKSKRKCCA